MGNGGIENALAKTGAESVKELSKFFTRVIDDAEILKLPKYFNEFLDFSKNELMGHLHNLTKKYEPEAGEINVEAEEISTVYVQIPILSKEKYNKFIETHSIKEADDIYRTLFYKEFLINTKIFLAQKKVSPSAFQYYKEMVCYWIERYSDIYSSEGRELHIVCKGLFETNNLWQLFNYLKNAGLSLAIISIILLALLPAFGVGIGMWGKLQIVLFGLPYGQILVGISGIATCLLLSQIKIGETNAMNGVNLLLKKRLNPNKKLLSIKEPESTIELPAPEAV